ncbi:helix-turn-helix transcriptional regulator [Sphingopyxis sp. SCN 67-31]|uniref:helix-turn-helix domain-containing protein n=1 Tax=Sphingopyxis sp. SCN 67-31 TaxID=1660142 RepID=UPI00257DDE3F|nr:helix-turn-helix transcriptional regulator [Sphingopyxis sp. SCN 67-31]
MSMNESRAIQKLRRRAADNSQTLDELADGIGVPFRTLSGWIFNGKIPKAGTIERLDKAGVVGAADWFLTAEMPQNETAQEQAAAGR